MSSASGSPTSSTTISNRLARNSPVTSPAVGNTPTMTARGSLEDHVIAQQSGADNGAVFTIRLPA